VMNAMRDEDHQGRSLSKPR